jgi:hypothetical protein
MVIRITWGRLRPGAWSEFERTYRENVIDGKTVKGLRGRLLVQDSGDKDTGFAMLKCECSSSPIFSRHSTSDSSRLAPGSGASPITVSCEVYRPGHL